jgi:tetrapyrrole methylase family protein/MazG family protein
MKRVKKATLQDLIRVMAKLRSKNGCPWDRKQTHKSLLKYLKEEAAEVRQAILKKDMLNLEEELGDLFLQILFHSQLASEKKKFDINDVLTTLKMKLVGRHPHVFGRGKKEKLSAKDVVDRWDELKAAEKANRMLLRGKK